MIVLDREVRRDARGLEVLSAGSKLPPVDRHKAVSNQPIGELLVDEGHEGWGLLLRFVTKPRKYTPDEFLLRQLRKRHPEEKYREAFDAAERALEWRST